MTLSMKCLIEPKLYYLLVKASGLPSMFSFFGRCCWDIFYKEYQCISSNIGPNGLWNSDNHWRILQMACPEWGKTGKSEQVIQQEAVQSWARALDFICVHSFICKTNMIGMHELTVIIKCKLRMLILHRNTWITVTTSWSWWITSVWRRMPAP